MSRLLSKILIYVFAIAWSLVTLIPLAITLLNSVKDNTEIYSSVLNLPKVYHFDYYYRAWTVGNMGIAFRNTLFIAAVSTFLLAVLATMASYVIARVNFKFNETMLMFFALGIMIPYNAFIIPLASIVTSFNGQNRFSTIILIHVASGLSLSVFIITGYMKGISREIDESAIIDGCGYFKRLYCIIAPLAMPMISTSMILSFIFQYKDLLSSLMFLTKKSMYTISLALLAFYGDYSVETGPIFAAVTISIAPMVIIYMIFQEKVEKGLTSGSVKG